MSDIVKAHRQRTTVLLLREYRDHQPRQGDPHYRLFERSKRRIKAAGLWVCALADEDCMGPLQLHHEWEWAYQNSVDLEKLNRWLGMHLDDEGFKEWIEQPGQLEVLCQAHHTGAYGVHFIPAADWPLVRVHRHDPDFEPVRHQTSTT